LVLMYALRRHKTQYRRHPASFSFLFNSITASPRLSRNPFIFINIFGAIDFHFLCSFVFIHIPGATFIFNIFLAQNPVPDFDQRGATMGVGWSLPSFA
jgi:hypothetical protein